ncbi:MAG TPA: TlpA disulfide reductase family protein [Polyangiaceae bacterium]|jgi:peroxiredoxin|nr:TlpA disulfide reductase family protein [Polyangiaceae bacterium]
MLAHSTLRCLAAACLSLGALTACAPKAGAGSGAALPETPHPLRGAPAPEFALAAPGGAPASPTAYAGKVVLLDFWATWCQPCKSSFPEYQALLDRYGDRLVVVGISEDDEQEGIARFAEETGASFPLAWDADKSIAQRYQINGMPTLFIIDPSGLVRYVHSGFRAGDEARISAAIDSLL